MSFAETIATRIIASGGSAMSGPNHPTAMRPEGMRMKREAVSKNVQSNEMAG